MWWTCIKSTQWSNKNVSATLCSQKLITGLSIVFFHDLTGSWELTWITKDTAACWPDLFLLYDLSEARIITYDYDADMINFWSMTSQNTISDHDQKLLFSLVNLRDSTNTVDSRIIKWTAQLISFNRAWDCLVMLQMIFH